MKKVKIKYTVVLTWCLCMALNVNAQTNKVAYQPTSDELSAAYRRTLMLDTVVGKNIYQMNVKPHWKPDGKSFWYIRNLANLQDEIIEVNAATGAKHKLCDRPQLLKAINEFTAENFKSADLKYGSPLFGKDGKSVILELKGEMYGVNPDNLKAHKIEKDNNSGNRIRQRKHFPSGSKMDSALYLSPDQRWSVTINNSNVSVVDNESKSVRQLTTDGTNEQPYGEVKWSPDSKYFVFYKMKIVTPKNVYKILTSVANTTRGQLLTEPYLQPGDENSSYEMYICNPHSLSDPSLKVDVPKIDFNGVPVLHFNKDNGTFLFNRPDRGVQRYQIIEVNAAAKTSRSVVDERTNTFIFLWRVFTAYLPKTNEIVYSSEKDGYRHIYLINTKTNAMKPITKGNWVLRGIDSIDVNKREIWFNASGVNKNEDPYNVHYYRIGFDGKNMVSLTPETGNHKVSYAPGYKYFVDTYSQVDVPPVHQLRRASDGKKISDLEKADVSFLAENNIRNAKPFIAKARDGKTDIYGIVCLPSNLDTTRTYPIVEYIYAGPHDSFVPKNFVAFGEMQSLANLGFVVVQMDGMGTANRSKAFHDVCWKNLADSGFPDRMLWIKAMAQKYSFADTSRVGIFGVSAGGQSALGALLSHPGFYKAAVSSSGCHDNRIDKQIWNEQWMGYPVGPHYGQQSNVTNAHKLRGALLLIIGEIDANVPPESSYRVADELIKANKTFDLLTIPGAGHTDGGIYGHRKSRDFFITHLLKVSVPNWNVDTHAAGN